MTTTASTRILCIGFTPALQRTMTFAKLEVGEVNRAAAVDLTPAGKGVNVAEVLKTLGSEPVNAGFVGGDSGRFIMQALKEEGIKCAWVETLASTRNCHTLLDTSSGETTELVEEMVPPEPHEWGLMMGKLKSLVPACAYIAISGKLPPESADNVYAEITALAAKAGSKVFLDSQKEPLLMALEKKPFLVKMNTHELGMTLKRDADTEDAVLDGMRELRRRGAEWVLVTKGPESVWVIGPDDSFRFTPPKVEAVNPIGSGDALTAGLIHFLSKGESVQKAVAYGIACGTANTLTPTSGMVRVEEVEELVKRVDWVTLG